MQEQKKESFFKKFFGGTSKKLEKNSRKTIKSIDNFDSGITFIKALILEKNWPKSLSIIEKIRKIEENNISLSIKNGKENEKEDIEKSYLEKIRTLDSFKKSIKDSIKKEKEEKKLKVLDQKITYVNNRIDFYVKNKQYDKAKDTLNIFYEKNKNDENGVSFYNNKKRELEESLIKKVGFFGNLFSKKKAIPELDKNEVIEEEKILELKEEIKEIEEKIDEPKQEEIKKEIELEKQIEEPKEEEIELEQEEPKKVGFFGNLFSKKKAIPELDKNEIIVEEKILETKEEVKEIEEKIEEPKQEEIKEEIEKQIEEPKQEEIKEELKQEEIDEIKEESKQEEPKQEEPKQVNNIRIGNQIKEDEKLIIEEKKEVLEINNNLEKQELESEKKEERKLGISALKKDLIEEKKVIVSLQKKINNVQDIDTQEENKLGVEKIPEIKNEENNEIIKEKSSNDSLVINDENRENINGFFNKFFSKDNQNIDKVVGLMDSVMKINDLDKAISTVEAVKNSEEKNIVIQEESNKAIGINENTEIIDKTNLIAQDVESVNTDKSNVITQDEEIINTVTKKEDESFIGSIFGLNKDEAKPEKKIKLEEIKDYYGAMKSIDYFIHIKDWDKARSGLEEVKSKEEAAFNKLYDKIDIEKERNKQKELYYKKLLKIEKMSSYLENEEIIYNEQKEIEKAKIKLVKVKEKLDELIGSKKYYEALDLITSFFDENKNSVVIINFFNKWKNIIQKKIKKYEKQKEKEISSNVKKEAEILIGENINLGSDNVNKIDRTKRKLSFFKRLLEKLNLYKKIKQNLKEKRLMDEVTLLIESQNEVDELARRSRLENIHMGLVKELDNDNLLGYELYAKILGRDKISGDTFGFIEDNKNYKFFLGDATGHGLQAGLIVTLLTRLFYNFSKDNFLEKLVYEVNNGLKQDLKSGNFITGIFFEVDKNNLDSIKYVGMGHEPMLIFRKKTMEVEKYIAGGLAAGIRIINDINNIKTHNIKLSDGDIVFIYSDGIVESRNKDNILLGIEGLAVILKKVCIKYSELKITDMYTSIMEEIRTYRGGSTNFYDDATMFILKRNTNKDIMDKKSRYLKDLSIKEGLSRANIRELEGKTKEEIEKKLEKIRKDKQLSLILGNLDKLYVTGEILKLKQEAIRYIKEGFIHKKINRFLKKAIQNERKYKIDLKDQKMKSKYSVLKELLKKGSYTTVINECNEIIAGDGNITI